MQQTQLHKRVVLITGGTAGIGKATATALAHKGASVVVVGRDQERGTAAVAEIVRTSGNPKVELMLADLTSQQSIRQLADTFSKRHQQLHVLINNAGALYKQHTTTVDNIETMLAVNHLAPLLLTLLLLPIMRASAPARIINVTSSMHARARVDLGVLQRNAPYNGMNAYAQAKLFNILSTYELARRLAGTGVTANVANPGGADTTMSRGASRLVALIMKLGRFTTEKAARSSVYLASSPEVEHQTGVYATYNASLGRSSRASYDRALAQEVWERSLPLIGWSQQHLDHLAKTADQAPAGASRLASSY
jgi:NAD(P)-dependent dehydrogenase (short-subunit alcohol dehydrogenase family)